MGSRKLIDSKGQWIYSQLKRRLSFSLVFTLLSIFFIFPISKAITTQANAAAACVVGGAAQNNIKVTPVHGKAFYVDFGVTPALDASYVGYQITNTSASAITGYWAKLSNFGQVVNLANPADDIMQIDNLGGGFRK